MATLNSTPCAASIIPPFAHSDEAAFFYVDGNPSKGTWVPLAGVESWADVESALLAAGFAADGGDILCADTEGALSQCCCDQYGTFDPDLFAELQDFVMCSGVNPEAIPAFMGWTGHWSRRDFENAYMGEYDSEEDFAEQYLDQSGMLAGLPDELQCYFDVERFARDVFMCDYYFDAGFVFCCNY